VLTKWLTVVGVFNSLSLLLRPENRLSVTALCPYYSVSLISNLYRLLHRSKQ
jgi:hypothetical protein